MALGTPSHTFSEIVSFSGTSATTTGSATFVNNKLYIMGVTVKAAAGATKPSSITGGGMTWVNINEATSATQNTSAWRALVTSGATSGTLTFNFAATMTEVICTVVSIDGADTTGTNGSGAIVQSATGSKASSTTFGDPDLPSLLDFGSTSNGGYAVVSHVANETTTPAAGWTLIEDSSTLSGGSNRAQATEWRINSKNPSVSAATAANWRGVSMEIKASTSGGSSGGSVIYGLWAGGSPSGAPGPGLAPNNDFDAARWMCGTDSSVSWANGTGIGRDPGMVRFRGAYGQIPFTNVLKNVSECDYWAARGTVISSNVKTFTSTAYSASPPLADMIGTYNSATGSGLGTGNFENWLTTNANQLKAFPGQVYCELWSEANVGHSPPASQPSTVDGPWPTTDGGKGPTTAAKNLFRDWCAYIVDTWDGLGVNNVTYVLSMAGTGSSVWTNSGTNDWAVFVQPLLDLETTRGKRYIDVIGGDAYIAPGKPMKNWDDLFSAGLAAATAAGKPFGVFETGCVGGATGTGDHPTGTTTNFTSKGTWYTQCAEWADYHKAHLAVVFHTMGEGNIDWNYAPYFDGNTQATATFSFSHDSWTAYKAMTTANVFTGSTVTDIAGSSSISFAPSGTLTTHPLGAGLGGQADITFAASADLTAGATTAALDGQAGIRFLVDGSLSTGPPAAMTASSAITFGAQGALTTQAATSSTGDTLRPTRPIPTP